MALLIATKHASLQKVSNNTMGLIMILLLVQWLNPLLFIFYYHLLSPRIGIFDRLIYKMHFCMLFLMKMCICLNLLALPILHTLLTFASLTRLFMVSNKLLVPGLPVLALSFSSWDLSLPRQMCLFLFLTRNTFKCICSSMWMISS
jgi:hypothetical protein